MGEFDTDVPVRLRSYDEFLDKLDRMEVGDSFVQEQSGNPWSEIVSKKNKALKSRAFVWNWEGNHAIRIWRRE